MIIRFTDEEIKFLGKEFHLSKEEIENLSEDELLGIADVCFDIELEGDLQDGKKVSDRCGLASSIVTKVNEMI